MTAPEAPLPLPPLLLVPPRLTLPPADEAPLPLPPSTSLPSPSPQPVRAVPTTKTALKEPRRVRMSPFLASEGECPYQDGWMEGNPNDPAVGRLPSRIPEVVGQCADF
jgi:hypothetical protein